MDNLENGFKPDQKIEEPNLKNTENQFSQDGNGQTDCGDNNQLKSENENLINAQVEIESISSTHTTSYNSQNYVGNDGYFQQNVNGNVNYENVDWARKNYLENVAQYERRKAIYNEQKERSKARTPLIFALLGLLCSLFMGIGIGFSIPALILGSIRNAKKSSKTHRWAIVISIVGIAVSIIFAICFVYALLNGYIKMQETL